ncbi:transglutaminase-like putative cysteine protease [Angulomicrobium tetraedrale]|uniref:Transglutaminase-like putative cysteine protease n=1 Tax=Ancylobacter tetraedralis TaxID=217068 RepID=A0A839ZDR4_9HYPH|nr:transglutaminase family protein [Ancylobacter tetraedralis]MBB3772817.1 transglutaminase-like putative cysteine protease [Ancylobacter tetraedralis]
MQTLVVRHVTQYNYANPVDFQRHRLMLRPRDSHDLRLVGAELSLWPHGNVHWLHDVFGNSVAVVDFLEPSNQLKVESVLTLERFGLGGLAFEIEQNAKEYPFVYSPDDRIDLGRMLDCHYPDPGNDLAEWANSFVAARPTDTMALLSDMNTGIFKGFAYQLRHEQGTQTPLETLRLGSGSCRDFALLLIEAARALGFGARFVTGYLYDPALDSDAPSVVGAGATHAWADIYLPGAGWIEFDPTNGTIAADNLIRVAVTRDPSQAVPVAGGFTGLVGDYLGMTVDVSVRAHHEPLAA